MAKKMPKTNYKNIFYLLCRSRCRLLLEQTNGLILGHSEKAVIGRICHFSILQHSSDRVIRWCFFRKFSFAKMEGYFVDKGPRRESQGEWWQYSEWIQRVSIPNFRENQNLTSQMLQGPNLLSKTFSAFHILSLLNMTNYNQGGGQLDSHHSHVRA